VINNLPESMLTKMRVQDCPVIGLDGMCWIWIGCLNSKGYGCIQFHGKRQLSHRVSYELHTGPIPAGLQIDHLCRQRACFNPHHLEAVTAAENVRRIHSPAEIYEGDQAEDDEAFAAWVVKQYEQRRLAV
jgi:hypothetical protein